MREALDLSNGDISGLFDEATAVLLYAIIVLVVVIPPVLSRVRDSRARPEDVKEEVSR